MLRGAILTKILTEVVGSRLSVSEYVGLKDC